MQNQNNIPKKRIKELEQFLKKLILNLNKSQNSQLLNQKNLKIINEALTHTSFNSKINHEKLEFLGDAVLRIAATEFIERNYPNMKVGERSELRAQIVSDEWLSLVGDSIGIYEVFLVGNKAACDTSARSTLCAEATEALIGAIYKCFTDMEPIHAWLTPYWQSGSIDVLSDPHKKNYKSALQEWSQGKGLNLPHYITEECNTSHAHPNRFSCQVIIENNVIGQGLGKSRRNAEKEAARNALENQKNY